MELTEAQKKQLIKEYQKLDVKVKKAKKPKTKKKIVKNCVICGSVYVANERNPSRQKYCCHECYYIAQRKRDKQKNKLKKVFDFCRWCKKKFEMKSPNQLFHHETCRLKYDNIKNRIQNLYPFNPEKTQKELDKLRMLGENYRFEDDSLNVFYNLNGGEKFG